MEENTKLLLLSLLFLLAAQGGAGGIVGGGRTTINGWSNSNTSILNNAYIALQSWKSAIKDDSKGILNSWVGSNVCDYNGVFCQDSSITGIDLDHGGLKGIFIKELSLLKDMTLLHLNNNSFIRTIPDSLKDLFALTELDLNNKSITNSPDLSLP